MEGGAKKKHLSEKLEKAGTVDFKKHPWGQGPPKVPGRFAFPVPVILEFVAFRDSGKFFQEFSSRTPEQTPETATAFSSFLNLS